MLGALFGNLTRGRLAPLPYVGYSVLITVIMMLMMLGMVFMIGAMEKVVGGDLQQAQAMIAEKLGAPAVILVFAIGLVLMYASINITIKRIRDMGLPVWLVIVGLIVTGGILAYLFPGEMTTVNGVNEFTPSLVSSIFQAIVFLSLVFVPSNTFGSRR